MKSSKIKRVLVIVMAVFILLLAWLRTYGIKRTIDKTIVADVYVDSDFHADATSNITISGNLIKTLFSTEYIGIFAIDYYERSCRDGVEAKIEWSNDGYQDIQFYSAGDLSHFNIQRIDIDKEMHSMMIVLNDGTIIKTQDYYVPTEVWKNIKANS